MVRLCVCLTLFLLPSTLFVVGLLLYYHLLLSTLFVLVAIAVLAESLCGRRTQTPPKSPADWDVAAVFVAYLPAEQSLIRATLEHAHYTGQFAQIVLAYNTPEPLPIEVELAQLPWLKLVKVPNSHSKAENLNYVLDCGVIDCPIVGIFDADHLPDLYAPGLAADWIAAGYAAVQGRCVVANAADGWLPALVRDEFAHIYRLLHQSRFNLLGTGIFGGSNCYWATYVLQDFRFDSRRLTEDIDLSLRAIEQGHAIAHDPRIISREVAPTGLGPLWRQRTRWAQGWTEVTLAHVHRLLRSHRLTWRQKAYWAYSMYFREAFTYLSMTVYLLLAWYTFHPPVMPAWATVWLDLSSALTVASLAAVALCVRAVDDEAQPLRYAALCVPYTAFKGLVHLNALGRMLVGNRSWVVTDKGAGRP